MNQTICRGFRRTGSSRLHAKLSELKPGERVILNVISNIAVDEEGHVWVDISSEVFVNCQWFPD